MVSDFRPDGRPHPFAGKTGVVTRLLQPDDEERDKISFDEPKFGMVELDVESRLRTLFACHWIA
jgi:hypothetical protein